MPRPPASQTHRTSLGDSVLHPTPDSVKSALGLETSIFIRTLLATHSSAPKGHAPLRCKTEYYTFILHTVQPSICRKTLCTTLTMNVTDNPEKHSVKNHVKEPRRNRTKGFSQQQIASSLATPAPADRGMRRTPHGASFPSKAELRLSGVMTTSEWHVRSQEVNKRKAKRRWKLLSLL